MKTLTLALLCLALPAAYAQTIPTEQKGVTATPLGAVELAAEIEGMAGRQLRARKIVVAPGGTIAKHNHADRPCVDLIVEGRIIEYRDGKAIEHGPGSVSWSDKNTTHGWENKGTVPVVILPVDIYHTP